MGLLFNRNRHRVIGGGSVLPPYTPVATSFAWQTAPNAVGLYSIGATGNVLAQVLDQHLVPMSPQPSISYTSATPSNISISGNTLTAVANGSSVITASSTGWTNLTGTATASQVLASIAVSGTAPIIGGNSTFTRNGKDALGVNMVSQPTVTWTSSDVSKATINSSTGVATGIASGSVNIIATAGSISGSLPINITAAAPVATTLIWIDSPPSFASIGITANSRAQINDQYGVAMASQAGITYSSNTTSVATINSSGVVTSVSNGSSVLNALYSGVTTIHQTASVSQVLVSIIISPATPTVPNGTVQVFTASGRDANAQTMSAGAGTWVSSDPTDFPINSSTGSCTPNVDSGSSVIKFTNTATSIFGTTTITASSASSIPAPSSTDYLQFDTTPKINAATSISDLSSIFTYSGTPLLKTGYDGTVNNAIANDQNGWTNNGKIIQVITAIAKASTSAITGSGTAQTVTLTAALTGATIGSVVHVNNGYNDGGPPTSYEQVVLTAVSGSTITGIFTKNQSSGVLIALEQTILMDNANSVTNDGGSSTNIWCCISPGLPVSTNADIEYVVLTKVDATHVKGGFAKNHTNPTSIGVPKDSSGGSGLTVFINNTYQPQRKVTMQYIIHAGNTSTYSSDTSPAGLPLNVPGSIGDRTAFEWNNNLDQVVCGSKIFVMNRPSINYAATFTQNVTASGSPQTVTVSSIGGLTVGSVGIAFGPGSQVLNATGETTDTNVTAVATGTITAVFAANHTNGDAFTLSRKDGRYYLVNHGPAGSPYLTMQTDSSPFYGNGINRNISSGFSLDPYIGKETVLTCEMTAESAVNAGDGSIRVWQDSTKIYDSVTASDLWKLGTAGWQGIEGPATFRSPALAQRMFSRGYRSFSPNTLCTAGTASAISVGTTTITNGVLIPAAPGGVADKIRPYVWNGSSYVANNGGGTSDPSFGDVTVPLDSNFATAATKRGTIINITHTGLTTGTAYQVVYTLLNGLGESSQSNAITQTPAFVAFTHGVDFRNSSGSTTDPTGFAFSGGTAGSPTFPNTYTEVGGGTFTGGWISLSGMDDRNRSGSIARLFGFTEQFGSATGIWQMALASAGGTYSFELGGGDNFGASNSVNLEVWDATNSVKLFSVVVSLTGTQYYDAMGNIYASQSAWNTGQIAKTGVVVPGTLLQFKLINSGSILSTIKVTRTA